jgi:DNA segregation ATPase FtsK/SpoIIIE, S-DNA-T family
VTATRLGFTVHTPQQHSDLLVTAPLATPLGELLPGLAAAGRLFVDGREVTGATPLSEAGVRDGAIISTRPQPPAVPTAAPGTLALMVAAGAAAGASCTIPARGLTVGRSSPLALADGEVSGRHFNLNVVGGGMTIADAGSTNGTVVAGEPLHARRDLAEGDLIWAGRTALVVARAPAADAPVSPTADGQLRYSRSPRLAERPRARAVALPDPPPEPQRSPFPILAVLVPLIAGLVMALVLRQPEFLAFIALSPVMLIGNAISERRRGKRGHQQAVADYELRREQAVASLAAARQAELRYRRHVHPDPAFLLLIASAPSCRLWERQPQDEDFLTLRVGIGTVPLISGRPERADGPGRNEGDELHDAPVTVALPECGAAGITGSPAHSRALARAMLLSAAVLHSPRDVSVTVLTSPGAADDWNWLRWLPHARQPGERGGLVRIGNDEVSVRARLDELIGALQARRPERDPGIRPARPDLHELVVLDGSYQLRMDAADLATLLREGPAAGIYFLCLDATPAQLPPECGRAIVQLSDDDGAVVARVSGPGLDLDRVTADVAAPAVTEAAARALAPLSETAGRAARDGLPDDVPFLTATGLEPPGAAGIRSRWAAGGRTTHALLGARSGGPFILDLAQGPHLLVAGTSGSGKSELLQTLVAALAVANRPDAMNFVLIDYKGGAAFRGFSQLPHTVGMLTDLDEFLVERALTSLHAELQRRKSVLDAADKSDIRRYWDALPEMPGWDPLPRLVIVVDEFAVMAEQLPDQLQSLMVIGRQGRSLGIHLVLATQRPAGIVNNDLRSNINQRIALRVSSPEDSRDIIEAPDAARIPKEFSGRAYAWLGSGNPVAFQTAYLGATRPSEPAALAPALARPLRWPDLGRPAADPTAPDQSDGATTDLSVLVAAIASAASAERQDGQRSPWLPPLPPVITLDQLPAGMEASSSGAAAPLSVFQAPTSRGPGPGDLRLPYGLIDQPRSQRQVPAVLDITRGGHLLAAGAPQSGRSTLLRTLAAALAAGVSPDEAQLYVLDGGRALSALAALPHCGAVVTADEPDRVDRLLARLTSELSTRTRLLASGGHSNLAEYRETQLPAARPPFLLVFVDQYDALVTALEHIDGGRLIQQVQRLMRDGLAAGIRVVVSGDRLLLTGRLAALAENKIVLRMADRADYAVAGLHSRAIPTDMPNGRGFALPSGDLLQIAMLTGQGQGTAENRALREQAARVRPPARPPFRVDALPAVISTAQALALPGHDDGILVGVGGDELGQVRVTGAGFLVIGPSGSGRSTALAIQAMSLAAAHVPLVLITPRRSPLAGAVDRMVVRSHLTGTDAEAATALSAVLGQPGPVGAVVDDAELLTGTPVGDELIAWYRQIRDSGSRLMAAASTDSITVPRGLILELSRGRCGLILGPSSPADGSPLGLRLPAAVLAGGLKLRGALIADGQATAVQVPELA